jgi:hypothetical protein
MELQAAAVRELYEFEARLGFPDLKVSKGHLLV